MSNRPDSNLCQRCQFLFPPQLTNRTLRGQISFPLNLVFFRSSISTSHLGPPATAWWPLFVNMPIVRPAAASRRPSFTIPASSITTFLPPSLPPSDREPIRPQISQLDEVSRSVVGDVSSVRSSCKHYSTAGPTGERDKKCLLAPSERTNGVEVRRGGCNTRKCSWRTPFYTYMPYEALHLIGREDSIFSFFAAFPFRYPFSTTCTWTLRPPTVDGPCAIHPFYVALASGWP